jgi:hypothetical protein
MTEQEKQLIAGLADRLRNAPPPHIDRDAEDLINRTIGAQPGALYILTQTVLIQEMALNQAKQQIEDLKQQAVAPQYANQPGGFLPGQSVQQPSYAPPPPPPPSGGGFSNFLHQAATTAAGVVAGDLAFEALGSLFGRHSYGGGGFFGGGSGIMPGSETIVNNYYGDQGGGDDRGLGGDDSRFADAANQSGDDMSPDIEDDRDSFAGDDSSYDNSGDDGSGSSDV